MGALEEAAHNFINANSENTREDAFRELAMQLQRALLSEIRAVCWNRDDVESVLQETLIKIARSIGDLRDAEKILPWASQIGRHTAMNSNRTRSRKLKSDFSIEEFEDAVQRGMAVQNPPLTPHEIARINELQAVIKTLGKKCQELLSDALDGLTAREISEKTGENPDSVATSLARCRKFAREALQNLEPHG